MAVVFEEYEQKYGFDYSKYPLTHKGNLHRTFNDLRAKGAVKSDMPCVATIREPLARIASWFNYSLALNKNAAPTKYSDPNVFWQTAKHCFLAQVSFFPEHATLFNTENLHEHASKYILDRGGKVENFCFAPPCTQFSLFCRFLAWFGINVTGGDFSPLDPASSLPRAGDVAAAVGAATLGASPQ